MNEHYDDSMHIAAPWPGAEGAALCGTREPRNLVRFDVARPGGYDGCWTCLFAADWIDRHAAQSREAVSPTNGTEA